MNVRVMTIDDYDKLCAIYLNTPGIGINTLDDSRDAIEKYLARNPRTSFVAENDGEIIGGILCGHDGRRGFIHHTAVAQSDQGRGVGALLVNAAVSALKREGIKKAVLVAFENNTTGNAFWEKQGFTTRPDLIYRNKAFAEMDTNTPSFDEL